MSLSSSVVVVVNNRLATRRELEVAEAEDTPLAVLVISVTYVVVALALILTLLTTTPKSNKKDDSNPKQTTTITGAPDATQNNRAAQSQQNFEEDAPNTNQFATTNQSENGGGGGGGGGGKLTTSTSPQHEVSMSSKLNAKDRGVTQQQQQLMKPSQEVPQKQPIKASSPGKGAEKGNGSTFVSTSALGGEESTLASTTIAASTTSNTTKEDPSSAQAASVATTRTTTNSKPRSQQQRGESSSFSSSSASPFPFHQQRQRPLQISDHSTATAATERASGRHNNNNNNSLKEDPLMIQARKPPSSNTATSVRQQKVKRNSSSSTATVRNPPTNTNSEVELSPMPGAAASGAVATGVQTPPPPATSIEPNRSNNNNKVSPRIDTSNLQQPNMTDLKPRSLPTVAGGGKPLPGGSGASGKPSSTRSGAGGKAPSVGSHNERRRAKAASTGVLSVAAAAKTNRHAAAQQNRLQHQQQQELERAEAQQGPPSSSGSHNGRGRAKSKSTGVLPMVSENNSYIAQHDPTQTTTDQNRFQQQQQQQFGHAEAQQLPEDLNNAAFSFQYVRPLRSWDLMSSATMRFRHGHFSGRSVQRLVQQERHAQELASFWAGPLGGESLSQQGDGVASRHSSSNSRRTGHSGLSQQQQRLEQQQQQLNRRAAVMSDVASHVLETQTVEGEAEYYRQRYIQKSAAQRQQQQHLFFQQQQQQAASRAANYNNRPLVNSGASLPNFRRLALLRGTSKGTPSVISRTSSGRSRMPALSPDVVSPEDAADAFDPGMSLPDHFSEFGDDEKYEADHGWYASSSCCVNLLDLAEPDDEVRRILCLAAPSTLSAVAEPFFRLGMVAIISHFIDTDSMIAFVLVILFVRITTEELSGAITDAESSMLHQALSMGGDSGFFMAGRNIQMAILLQLFLAVPILLAWALVMEDVVSWLVPGNDQVGRLAAEYTHIIVIDYALQAASRTFMLVFHVTGQAQFELNVDLIAAAVTIAAISLTSSLAEEPTLKWIAGVQVVIGVIKIATKVGIVVFKGLLEPYRKGLLGSWSLSDRQATCTFIGTTMPLLLGSLIELREWEILLLFVRHLGGVEVAAWALMGILWEIFEASTEGLGEAAAVRVSLILAENLPDLAKQLAHKSVLLGMILSFVVTSIFLLLGRNLSVALTEDPSLQKLFNDLVGTTGLANIAMSMAQVYWSLLGSQGRFGVASSSILLCRWLFTMPLAAFFIFWGDYDVSGLGSALAMGYMTSTLLLASRLFRSDWKLFAQLAQEEAMLGDDDDDDDDDEDIALLNGGKDRGQGGENIHDENDEEDEDEDYDDDDDDSSCSTGFG
ncbi:hypothetical protein ACA910_002018 [Epithemia clementina (nom. ined.)]